MLDAYGTFVRIEGGTVYFHLDGDSPNSGTHVCSASVVKDDLKEGDRIRIIYSHGPVGIGGAVDSIYAER